MTARRKLWSGLALALTVAAAGCQAAPNTREAARERNLEVVEQHGRLLEREHPRDFVAVQDGDLAGATTAPDDVVRVAERSVRAPLHRYVFRPADRGDRLYRMAFMPRGRIVGGRKLLADLGFTAAYSPGRALELERLGRKFTIDLTDAPSLAMVVTTLDRGESITLDVAIDPDFDGGLLVDGPTARLLELHTYEIPGDAALEVALGRPFDARRAMALVDIPSLGAAGPAELLYDERAQRKRVP